MITVRLSLDHTFSHGVNCFGNVADPCTQGPNNGYQSRPRSTTITRSVRRGAEYDVWLCSELQLYEGVAEDFPDFNPVTTLGLPQYFLTSGYLATPNVTFGNGYQAVSGQTLGSQTFSILTIRSIRIPAI